MDADSGDPVGEQIELQGNGQRQIPHRTWFSPGCSSPITAISR